MIVKKSFLRDGRIYKFKPAPRSLLVSRGGGPNKLSRPIKIWLKLSYQKYASKPNFIKISHQESSSSSHVQNLAFWAHYVKYVSETKKIPQWKFRYLSVYGMGDGHLRRDFGRVLKEWIQKLQTSHLFLVYWDSMLLVLLWVWGVFNF